MLTELCKELNNWFDTERLFGDFDIVDGKLTSEEFISKVKEGQYIRIAGSTFNDGVYKYDPELELTDESFHGAVWLMAVPPKVLELADDISEWQTKYGGVDSANMSPYTSESFGGYSYSKGAGSSESETGGTWQGVFKSRLNQYRKVHPF